ncbi:type 1 glutamine amidotransferase [Phycicoccus endophyticus]|uniref:Type 1 glutamine amidotransferase n=1 Tax=Phycicoccus endophyticus TaxID=1690220 RepID=A0A7G9R199_9MICO|nr:type 1 glutamine amidotransferase [Phycicoccus endophyticus]NHI18851.1 type 1 glutamine amidotransferase [Phycicoccus endophyticus]QNN49374.1 type 1 glutamine amidotransferase [Phycicoccus endophyticus]GGL36031.1 aminotransferase [Phycicoccus endophyticus]
MADAGSPALLVVRNDPGSGPGRFAGWCAEAGVRLDLVDGADVPTDPDGHAGVVLLGGGFMPDADERAPWLPRERALCAAAVRDGVPLLGICLGAQLLAQVTGGRVLADSGRPERGSVTVRRLPPSDADPVLGGLPRTFPAIENHRDEVATLPPGAVHLAASDTCQHQAFRVGERAWGVQFHPEVGAERLDRWDPARLADEGVDLAALRAGAQAAEPASASAARLLLEGFLAVVRHPGRPTLRPPIDQ